MSIQSKRKRWGGGSRNSRSVAVKPEVGTAGSSNYFLRRFPFLGFPWFSSFSECSMVLSDQLKLMPHIFGWQTVPRE